MDMSEEKIDVGIASGIIAVYKKPGETPLQRLDRLRLEKPQYAHEKLSYLGRLDPLAEGVLLVAAGEGNKKREEYLSLPKEYIVDILFGFGTDTFDVMGIVDSLSTYTPSEKEISEAVSKLTEIKSQVYPAFSSKTVQGKSLFAWAREGLLETIQRPVRPVEIFSSGLIEVRDIGRHDLLSLIHADIARVNGDFRQEAILSRWNEVLGHKGANDRFCIARIKITCGSGVYMRGLAQDMAKKLKTEGLALHIQRSAVGKYRVFEDIG